MGALGWVRRRFLAGLVVVVPGVVTVLVLRLLFLRMDSLLGPWIARWLGHDIPGLGLLVTLLLVLLVGVLAANLAGRRLITWAEELFERLPLVRRVYGASKAIVASAMLSQKQLFQDVVLVEDPRRGMHSCGFVTSYGTSQVGDLRTRIADVFIPGPPLRPPRNEEDKS